MKKARGVAQRDTGSKPNVDGFWRGLPLRVDRVERVVPVRRAGRAEPINRKSESVGPPLRRSDAGVERSVHFPRGGRRHRCRHSHCYRCHCSRVE